MKKTFYYVMITSSALIISSCKKDSPAPAINHAERYTSLDDFFSRNGAQTENHVINASTGGMFISAKGTKVTIPANAFQTVGGTLVTGTVTISFKDIYSKSEMVLSGMPTMTTTGQALKSGGEFFIQALSGGNGLTLVPGQAITAELPVASGTAVDTTMTGYSGAPDSTTSTTTWTPDPGVEIFYDINSYICSLTYLPPGGLITNCDHAQFTSATLTQFNVNATGAGASNYMITYLIFPTENTVVAVGGSGALGSSSYEFAPVGYPVNIAVLSLKDGKVYSAFTSTTISASQTVSCSLSETTAEQFKSQLDAWN